MVKSRNSDSPPHSNSPHHNSKNRVFVWEKEIPTSDPLKFEAARCPICLDPPHNSVLLECTSSGCHPYICNTSSRHSNCLDKFVQSQSSSPSTCLIIDPSPACPLCRGKILGWFVNVRARAEMNLEVRECSYANCDFAGSYEDLRRHSRTSHVSVSPWDVDPQRRQAWATIERQHHFATFYFPEDEEEPLFSDDYGSFVYSPSQNRTLLNNSSFPFLFPAEESPVWPSPARSIDLNVEPRNDEETNAGPWYGAMIVVSSSSEGESSWDGGNSTVESSNTGMPPSRASNDPLSFSLVWPPRSFSVSDYCGDSNNNCRGVADSDSRSRSRSL